MKDYEELVARLRERAGAMEYDGWTDTADDYENAASAIELLSKRAEKVENIYCKEFITRAGGFEVAYVAYFDIRKISEEAVNLNIANWGADICHPYIAVVTKEVACNVFGYQEGILE